MPKFAANLTMLFNEFDFLERFEQASKVGVKAVEFLWPYAYDKKYSLPLCLFSITNFVTLPNIVLDA